MPANSRVSYLRKKKRSGKIDMKLTGGKPSMEIERKFTIRQLPVDLEKYPKKELEQGYLCKKPIVRVRRVKKDGEKKYILCYKSKLDLEKKEEALANVCEEVELKLTKEAYEALREKADGRIIRKTRYLIPYGKYTIELDIFGRDLKGLMFAEVEFPSEEEANAFVPPDWFDRDVSFDKRFRNSYLAMEKEAVEELKMAGFL